MIDQIAKFRWVSLILLAGSFCFGTDTVVAQEMVSSRRQAANAPSSEFGARQRLVERKMVELESQLTLIAERIREKDPKKADRLVKAYQESRERLITRKMAEVSELLDQNNLTQAEETLDEVVQNLERLIRLLINEKTPEVSKQQEIEMLEKIKQDIEKRVEEQKQQRQEVAKIDDRAAAAEKLAAQIEKLDNLIEQQQNAIDQAKKNRKAGLRALDKVADQQFKIRQQTEALAKELGDGAEETEEGTAKDSEPKHGSPSEGGKPPGSEKPGESNARESKSGESKSGESEPRESKPGESKTGESKSGEGKSGQPGKGSKGTPGGKASESGKKQSTPNAPQPGQQALEKATEQQRSAEEKLGSARAEEAQKEQEKALDNLEKALAELKKEKRRIESLPPDAIKDMARRQRRTRDKAMEIVKKMNDAPKSKSDDGSGQSQQPKPQQTPGQNQMEQAGQSMKKAADQMDGGDNQQAKKDQKKAQEEMEQAIDEIEERLNQLREETQEEKLARLEARFREMYERQKVASAMTIELDDKRVNLGSLNRRDQLLMLRVGTDEQQISEIGQQAYDLMLEDGTSVVFPEAVQDLRLDLQQVATLMFDDKSDRFTQLLQKEIEAAILDLLDSLEQAKNEKKGGGGGGGGGGGKQPLLKKSAELKILRRQQQRLNRRTRRVEQLRGSEVPSATLDGEVKRAADMQIKLLEMTERLIEKE